MDIKNKVKSMRMVKKYILELFVLIDIGKVKNIKKMVSTNIKTDIQKQILFIIKKY